MTKKVSVPLIIENYPPDYNGYKFISVIKYNDINTLNIIDNVKNKNIHTYVLDLCKAENVEEDFLIKVAENWYNTNRDEYPLSIEFSKLGVSSIVNKILRVYPIDYVTRIIGYVSQFPMSGAKEIRRKRRKNINNNK